MEITLIELEQAINYWRARKPATGEECALSPEVNALATVYALMIFHRTHSFSLATLDFVPRQLIEAFLARPAATAGVSA
ncbi:DUF3717 domain-containing protein [Janthinobacterium sp. 17J80-10]|uniref:DUF3717 domain-containing protein n=1 Tax=Janthinobacterium sp. 17J80-10 TaxID=2497863 RepID=UPI0010059A5E|nr:DUF3717 domain-containing protein [Janthinobacterium sp. 17J80-10]QAU32918.1 DUF3717 domain-containing protein [Janthinobacterium sp. 17J80-10]